MHDLQLVGVHDDGEHLLLTGGDGQRYRVPIDDALRAAVRRDRARLGQLQIAMDDTLRPKDIQARIRSGESAEEVAATSGLPVEHVRRYEGAVLAEREHVARRARSITVRRRHAQAPTLEDVVVERLSARDAAATREWDAWRREDGSWTVHLVFRTGSRERTAHWRLDGLTSTLEPLDDEARWLTADTDAEAGPVGGRRLAAVKERVYDIDADGGVREQPRNDPGEHRDEQVGERERRRTVELLETLRGRRGRRRPGAEPDVEPDVEPDAGPPAPGTGGSHDSDLRDSDLRDELLDEPDLHTELFIDEVLAAAQRSEASADDPRTGPGVVLPRGLLDEAQLDAAMRASERGDDEPPAAHPPLSRPEQATDARILALPGPVADGGVAVHDSGGTAETADGRSEVESPTGTGEPVADAPATGADEPGSGVRGRGRSKRAAVPSWDDIVFGARRDS